MVFSFSDTITEKYSTKEFILTSIIDGVQHTVLLPTSLRAIYKLCTLTDLEEE